MLIATTLCLYMLVHSGTAAPDTTSGPVATLVENGKPAAVLMLPASPHADEELAAQELRDHIDKMSGAKLEIRTQDVPDGLLPVRIGLSLSRVSLQQGARGPR
jgi:hypothetical protein